MTEYLNKSFSVCVGGDQEYRDRWDATFGKKDKQPQRGDGLESPLPTQASHCTDDKDNPSAHQSNDSDSTTLTAS